MIERGPRAEAVREAVAAAIASFSEPLDDAAIDAGWTEEDRLAALGELEALQATLTTDATASLPDFDLPADAEDDPRSDAIEAVDFLADDLALASEALDDANAFLAWLESDDELDDDVRGDLVAAASRLRDALAAGEYLRSDEVEGWLTALERHGCRRQHVGPTPADPSYGPRIVEWPKGRAWDEIVVFEHRMVPIFGRDRLALDEAAETS